MSAIIAAQIAPAEALADIACLGSVLWPSGKADGVPQRIKETLERWNNLSDCIAAVKNDTPLAGIAKVKDSPRLDLPVPFIPREFGVPMGYPTRPARMGTQPGVDKVRGARLGGWRDGRELVKMGAGVGERQARHQIGY